MQPKNELIPLESGLSQVLTLILLLSRTAHRPVGSPQSQFRHPTEPVALESQLL